MPGTISVAMSGTADKNLRTFSSVDGLSGTGGRIFPTRPRFSRLVTELSSLFGRFGTKREKYTTHGHERQRIRPTNRVGPTGLRGSRIAWTTHPWLDAQGFGARLSRSGTPASVVGVIRM